MAEPAGSTKPKIVLAGASGVIGQALCHALVQDHDVIALSRRAPPRTETPRLQWRRTNFFDLQQTEQALQGAHVGIYLVNNMVPQARFCQGTVADLNLLCADNFARAAKRAGLKRIIYLSELMPDGPCLSRRLTRRLEVERALADHGVPVTILRAGPILGVGGATCSMMLRMVKHLYGLNGLNFTAATYQPVRLGDVLRMLTLCVDDATTPGHTWDIGGPDRLTYAQMVDVCAQGLRANRLCSWLLTAWFVKLAGAPLGLVRSWGLHFDHPQGARSPASRSDFAPARCLSVDAAPQYALANAPCASEAEALPEGMTHPALGAIVSPQSPLGVISVQRMVLPKGKNARWVARLYATWLPQAMAHSLGLWMRVRTWEQKDGRPHRVHFDLRGVSCSLLQLQLCADRSDGDRQVYAITGGLLAGSTHPHAAGQFEFRTVLGGKHVLVAMHNFIPRLPWLVYLSSQAWVHLWVMRSFANVLRKSR